MNNGDDIHNLLKTLGHDAGLYQDLAKYNASRAASRRAAMGRPPEAAALPASPAPAPVPVALTTPRDEPAALSAILHRLSNPDAPRTAHARGQTPATSTSPPPVTTPQPARLDRLFGRLVTRTFGTPDR